MTALSIPSKTPTIDFADGDKVKLDKNEAKDFAQFVKDHKGQHMSRRDFDLEMTKIGAKDHDAKLQATAAKDFATPQDQPTPSKG